MSLPVRERGLKSSCLLPKSIQHESLPVRERGLKWLGHHWLIQVPGSLPVRERGLKYPSTPPHSSPAAVAPCAGAWVEITV